MANLLYFGRLADVTGKTFDTVSLPNGVNTIASLRTWLDQKFGIKNVFQAPEIRAAVDNEFVDNDRVLNGNEEIAFMPPVGGG